MIFKDVLTSIYLHEGDRILEMCPKVCIWAYIHTHKCIPRPAAPTSREEQKQALVTICLSACLSLTHIMTCLPASLSICLYNHLYLCTPDSDSLWLLPRPVCAPVNLCLPASLCLPAHLCFCHTVSLPLFFTPLPLSCLYIYVYVYIYTQTYTYIHTLAWCWYYLMY